MPSLVHSVFRICLKVRICGILVWTNIRCLHLYLGFVEFLRGEILNAVINIVRFYIWTSYLFVRIEIQGGEWVGLGQFGSGWQVDRLLNPIPENSVLTPAVGQVGLTHFDLPLLQFNPTLPTLTCFITQSFSVMKKDFIH